jgi:HTH-type transcriptional regulator / antitoxin HigA
MTMREPAEVFPPGDFLKEELDERGWSQQELADILDRPPRLISEIIGGKRAITPETALGLSEALDTSADYWMNLESQYQLSKVKVGTDTIQRKARLYEAFPVREMLRMRWIEGSDDLATLEHRFCSFFDIPNTSVKPSLLYAAKKTDATSGATQEQVAWLYRVRQLASTKKALRYSEKKLREGLVALERWRQTPEDVARVPELLAHAGVQLVCVEPVSGSKIDGACLWLHDRPIIGMTLRFDRIDNFWFVLRHEIEHVLNKDGRTKPVLDTEVGLDGGDLPKAERLANAAAANFCVPQADLTEFIQVVAPYFSEEKVVNFAERMRVHPGLVVGQIQRRLNRHDFLRKHQVKIRHLLLQSALSDGWGAVSTIA